MGLSDIDAKVLRHYHLIALSLAAVNLLEAVDALNFTVDGLAWFNLVGAGSMAVAWPAHEAIVRARRRRTERYSPQFKGEL